MGSSDAVPSNVHERFAANEQWLCVCPWRTGSRQALNDAAVISGMV
jgi:hypothetical protein